MLRPRLNVHFLPLLPFLSLLFQPALASASPSPHATLTGAKVHIYNLVGKVQLVAGSGSAVQVDLVTGGKDAARLGSQTFTSNGTFFVVTYPSDHIRYPDLGWRGSTNFQVAKDGTFGGPPKRSGWLDRKVRIDGKGGGLEAWCDLRIAVPRGQTLSVHLGVGDIHATNVDGELFLDAASAGVTASGGRGNLVVDTGSGGIAVSGRTGDVRLDSGSGSVDATNLTGDKLVFDTGSGEVVVRNARARQLTADTGSGSVVLSGVAADRVHVDTGSGDVRLALTRDVDALDVDTGSGSVTVEAPATLGASLRIATGSGDIRTDFPLRVSRRESDTLIASIGDGAGHIVIDTGSGDVRLRRSGAN
jgi:hypothetical protein